MPPLSLFLQMCISTFTATIELMPMKFKGVTFQGWVHLATILHLSEEIKLKY